jgi:hypothetical protein
MNKCTVIVRNQTISNVLQTIAKTISNALQKTICDILQTIVLFESE